MYRILRELGRGGMGVVYLAERDDVEFVKRAAVKVIRRGTDTGLVLQRFRNERQILANLDHPNIGRLLDGGTTTDGLPYFIMEYVEGQPIDQYADSHQMTILERLKLFRTVCSAVQYAHQNLVVHCDIKPSNILVANGGEPKLLDFGIAKLLQTDSEQEAELTATALRVMTPEFASPEQVKGERITTSSDVYSLGVLLYKLLTGLRPYRLNGRNPDELVQAIREQQPEKPSHSIADFGLPNGESKLNPQSAIRNPKSLRGDLDNIVLMALRKEPQRRYASVEQFSEDIRRHLQGLPVLAHNDTFRYRASKFIHRNKFGVAGSAVILLTLLGGIFATGLEAHISQLESTKAQQRFNEVRKLAHSILFDYQDAVTPLAGSTQLRQLMVNDSLEYLDSLAKDAGDDLSLQREIGTAYQRIGDVQGGNLTSPRGGTLSFSNLGDTPGALESYRRALTIREKLAALEPANVDVQQEWGTSIVRLGELSLTMGKPSASLEYMQQAMGIYQKLLAVDPTNEVLRAKTGSIYLAVARPLGIPGVANLGKDAESLASLQKALVAGQALAADYPREAKYKQWIAAMFGNMGRVLIDRGNPAEALASYRKALPLYEALVKETGTNAFYRRELATACGSVGIVLLEMGNKREALASCRQAVDILESLVAADPNDSFVLRDLAVNRRNLAEVLAKNDDRLGARATFDQALKILDELTTKDPTSALVSYQRGLTYLSMSKFLADSGDPSGAANKIHEAIKIGEALIAIAAENNSARDLLAQSYWQLGKRYALLAAKATTGKGADEWLKATSYYQKSLDIFQDMKNGGTLSGAEAGKPDDLTLEIVKCDAALTLSRRQ
jgi:non-specific serine/threonine protein kinase/serine/threonine-protein kinase